MTTTSTLAGSDPDLVGYFDAFAFDQVPAHDDLDQRTRQLCQPAALIACQAMGQYRIMLPAALAGGVDPVEVKEVVYQAVPYLGMGKVDDFLLATNEILTEQGIDLPLPSQATTTPEDRRAEAASGTTTPPTGLDLPTRELITFALPVSHGGCDRQAPGHVQGNLNVGNDRAMLINVVTQLLPFIGYPRTLNGIAAVNEVAPSEQPSDAAQSASTNRQQKEK